MGAGSKIRSTRGQAQGSDPKHIHKYQEETCLHRVMFELVASQILFEGMGVPVQHPAILLSLLRASF